LRGASSGLRRFNSLASPVSLQAEVAQQAAFVNHWTKTVERTPMRRATLLALSLLLISVWSHDSARAQSSANKPVALVPPSASPPHAATRSAKPTEPSPPVIGGLPVSPPPAADYDGFTASTDESDAPSQLPPPARSRSAKGSGLDSQSLIDQDDEALKRKLTICKNCK
jgi:hypothetical protein